MARSAPDVVVDAFRQLPPSLGAALLLLGDGPYREQFAGAEPPSASSRRAIAATAATLPRWLASADLYVSAMADETFGISIIEAQASGLPVVGVAAGAMIDRVPDGLGLVGTVGDAEAMAANILAVLGGNMQAMSEQARAHALQFSWDQSMERLFGRVYAHARLRAAERVSLAGAKSAGALVGVLNH